MTSATLVLEDGSVLQGHAFGAQKTTVFELVFNTSMTGYQEIISDPSYRGQGVLFTVPHIGNVGVNLEDYESNIPQVSAVVVRELSSCVSNWRSITTLSDWLVQHDVPGISGVDTRWLTRKLREEGTMKAVLSTNGTSPESLLSIAREWPGLDGRNMVQEVTSTTPFSWKGDPGEAWVPAQAKQTTQPGKHVVLFDYGAKQNIIRHLAALGLSVTIVPADFTCTQAMALKPDAFLLSNGPGDPGGLPQIVGVVRDLISTGLPIFGICLGHQLISRAMGGATTRLKFGHHSGNHPVLDVHTGKVQITSQNHNYAAVIESLDPDEVEVTHLSLNDRSLEGIRLRHYPVFSVQYHPEASPGPHDSFMLFQTFNDLINR